MNNLMWLALLVGFSTHVQAEDMTVTSKKKNDKTGSKLHSITAFPVVNNKTENNTVSPKVLEDFDNSTKDGADRNEAIGSTLEEKVQKRGLGMVDLSYGFGDKFDHAYYLGQDFPTLPPVPPVSSVLPVTSQAPPVYTFPPGFFPTVTTTTPAPFFAAPATAPPSFATFPPDFFLAAAPPAAPTSAPPSQAPINLGHSTHIEKTITFYQGIPQPYPVIKHVPVPVEKHVPVEVKVPVPVPVAVEKTVHVPVKVPVKVPVAVPQPYPVVKEVRVPVKVFVDKPYPVYVHQHVDCGEPPVPLHASPEPPHYHFEHPDPHVHWQLPEKPSEEVYEAPEDALDPSLVHYHDHHHPHHLHHDHPQFVTLEKPEYEYEKIYSASNKVEDQKKPHREEAKRPSKEHKYPSRGANYNNPEHSRPNDYHHDRDQNKQNHRDVYDHRNHGRRDRNDRNPHNYRQLDRYRSQRNNHHDYSDRRRNQNSQNYQDRREHRQESSESRHSDEFVLHANFK